MNFTYADFCAFVNVRVDLGHKYFKEGRTVNEDFQQLKRDFEKGDPDAKRFVTFTVLHRLVGGTLFCDLTPIKSTYNGDKTSTEEDYARLLEDFNNDVPGAVRIVNLLLAKRIKR